MTDADRDRALLFVLQELERLTLLIDHMVAAGALSPVEEAKVSLRVRVRQQERLTELGVVPPQEVEALRQRLTLVEADGR